MAEPQRLAPDEESADEHGAGKMGFLEHLDELRARLIHSCLAAAAGMAIAFLFVGRIADFVLAPVYRGMPPDASLIMTRPGEGLSFYLDLALMGGVLLAAPFVTFQVWRFIAPGLYAREKRLVLPFVVCATLGTIGGAAFSHYVLFPSMMAFFGTFNGPRIRFMPTIEHTFDLYKNTMIGMVAVFQIPTLVFFLARIRLVTARLLWQHIKYAVLAIVIVAAVLTPSPDPGNMALFAAPMLALYVISIGIAWVVAPRRPAEPADRFASRELKLVFVAAVIDHARRRDREAAAYPRLAR